MFLSLESRGDFEGRLVGRVDFCCWRFLFFFFPFSFFSLDERCEGIYITRVKLASLFDAFVKFVHFFMEFDARILFLFDKIL